MAFSPEDIESLVTELQRDPQLRDRLRSVILADDFLALPRIVADLGVRIQELVEADRALAARLDTLTERMDTLTERIDTLTERMDTLTERMDTLTERMDTLAKGMTDLLAVTQLHDGRLGNLEGDLYELRYQARMPSRLGRRYMKVRPVHIPELEPVSRAYGKQLADAEWDDLLEIDAAAWAQPRSVARDPESPDILVVLELSRTVNAEDVRRVHRRAEILRRLGMSVDAAVDGEAIRPDAKQLADQLGVVALVVKEPQAA